MNVRRAIPADLDEIMGIYDTARAFMRQNGNRSQWINGYPQKELVQKDIAQGHCFVCEEEGIHGVFAFLLGEDPTYNVIEKGAWLNDRPYGTIHRIGSDGQRKQIFRHAVGYCLGITEDLRIDTHEDNKVMQRLVENYGFQRCGIIYIEDGTPRIAYHYTRNGENTKN